MKVFPRLSETFVINEIRELERQGLSVHVFSLHAAPAAVPHGVLRDLEAPVTCVEALAEPAQDDCRRATAILRQRIAESAGLGERLLPRKYVRLALQLAQAIRERRLSRLHAHFASRATHVAMLASQLLDIQYSFTAHAKDIYHDQVDHDALRVKMRLAKQVLTVSDFNRRALLEIGRDVPDLDRKIVRAYNGVDLSLFRPAASSERIPGRVLAVGRLVEKKGFSVLIRACGLLTQRGVRFNCEIIGAGDQEPALRALIRELALDDTVVLTGALPVEQVAVKLRGAALLVLPCVVAADGNVDALPTVLLEAMGCGLPVISSALSGIPEIIVDGENGRLVPPGDATALADAMAPLLEDRALAERLGQAGRTRAERLFDLPTNVARLRGWLIDRAPLAQPAC